MDKQKILLELMHDDIEFLLTEKQYQIYVMSKSMKPRHIASKLEMKRCTVVKTLYRIKLKLEEHGEARRKQLIRRGLD